MISEQQLQEMEHRTRGPEGAYDMHVYALIAEVRRLQQEMVKCQDIWSTTIAEGMESTIELQQQRDAALAERDDARQEMQQLRMAVGLLTTLHPTMEMDSEHPLEMAQQIEQHVSAALTEARRVLREVRELFPDTGTPDPDHSVALYYGHIQAALAAVLAQDESAD